MSRESLWIFVNLKNLYNEPSEPVLWQSIKTNWRAVNKSYRRIIAFRPTSSVWRTKPAEIKYINKWLDILNVIENKWLDKTNIIFIKFRSFYCKCNLYLGSKCLVNVLWGESWNVLEHAINYSLNLFFLWLAKTWITFHSEDPTSKFRFLLYLSLCQQNSSH